MRSKIRDGTVADNFVTEVTVWTAYKSQAVGNGLQLHLPALSAVLHLVHRLACRYVQGELMHGNGGGVW